MRTYSTSHVHMAHSKQQLVTASLSTTYSSDDKRQRTHTGKNIYHWSAAVQAKHFFHFWNKWPKKDKGMFSFFSVDMTLWTWLCARAELTVTITSRELPSELYTGKQMSLLYNSSKIVTGSSICTQYKLPHTADTSGDVAWDLWQQLRSNKLALIAQLSRSCLLRKLIQQLVLTPGPPEGVFLHYKTTNEIAFVILNDRVLQLNS